MADLEGVNLKKLDGGLGRTSETNDAVILVVGSMPITGTTLVHNNVVELIQIKDLEDLGVNESFDANNKALAYYHISESFRLAPESTILFMPVAVNSTIQAKTTEILTAIRGNKSVKGLALFGFTNDISTLADEVEVFQASIVDEIKKDGILLDFVLVEGKGKIDVVFNDLEDLRAKNAPQISLVIAQDRDVANLDAEYLYHASVGSAVGMIAVRKVNENMGSTNIKVKPDNAKLSSVYPLTDEALGKWKKAGISIGVPMDELSAVQVKSLNTKGYIFVGSYADAAGFYFSNSCTCVTKTSDYAYIENNRTWNKAARYIRTALTPEIKGTVKKDPQTGYIKSTTISRWQKSAEKALEKMLIADEISGSNVYINPKQIVNEDNPVKIRVMVVSDDIAHEFDVELGLTNKV
jgi:hypothetical protein